MTTAIHAHKVLNLLREKPMSRDELVSLVEQQFGKDAEFRTCSREGFDLEALLSFFIEKQKVIEQQGVWQLNIERVCSH
ncbi:YecH family metal-binding protein [Vibrio cionasavignyae]|uniref:YecH family metal-binding protein n=1 Tax=Vibrio cionasavignyae TaxID=2910252 RepID=UPI003D0A14D5